MSNLSTLPKGDSAWLLRKAIERIMEQVSVLETNIGSSTTGNSANTQIIFNDNGTLRGDAGLVYNKTTDALTVAGLVTAGSAAITGAATVGTTLGVTGDLTVATDAFKVISATKDVCIGTVTPTFNNKLTVVGGAGGDAFITSGNGTRTGYIGTDGTHVIMGGYSNHSVQIHANDIAQMRIAPLGVFEWFDGASGTRMTLNSTGLGIGDAPATNSRLTIGSTNATGFQYALRTTGITTGRSQIYLNNTSGSFIGGIESSVAGTTITGTAAYSSYVGTSTANPFHIVTNGSVKATVDSSGNVGIGVTPNSWSSAYKFLMLPNGGSLFDDTSNGIYLAANYYALAGAKKIASGYALNYLLDATAGAYKWYTSTAGAGTAGDAVSLTQAMTLDASGNLYVGKTSSTSASTGCELQTGTGGNAASVFTADAGSASIMNRLTSDGTIIDFRRETLSVGNIAVTTLATTYNSISDYRLKEAVQPLVGGLARVSALKPSIYKWKVNGSDGEGFLAHELASVVSAAVTGEKDAVNEDGSINAQSIDMSRIVPILVAAIQELTARVQTLEAR